MFIFNFTRGKVTSSFRAGSCSDPHRHRGGEGGGCADLMPVGTRLETSSFASRWRPGVKHRDTRHRTQEHEQQSPVAGVLVLASFSRAKSWGILSWPSSVLRGRKNQEWVCPPGRRASLATVRTLPAQPGSPAPSCEAIGSWGMS